MNPRLTICDRWRHQLHQILLTQPAEELAAIPAQTEAQLYREQPGGAVLRLFDE